MILLKRLFPCQPTKLSTPLARCSSACGLATARSQHVLVGNIRSTNSGRTRLRLRVLSRQCASDQIVRGMVDVPQSVGPRRAAIVQMTATNDKDKNFRVCEQLAQQAKEQGCLMVFYPECFAFIGARPGEAQRVAEPVDGPWLQRYKDLAKREGLWMSLGGFHEYGDGDKIYNAHIVLDSEGQIRAHYRKIHLFDVPMVGLVESKQTLPGKELAAIDTPIGRLGISICYDLRFPEVYQKLRFVHGADILLAPSAFAVKTGQAHWETLLRARAIETQCYMLAAAQAGQHNTDGNKRCSYGHAMAVDPWGTVLGDLGAEGSESGQMFVVTIDPLLIKTTRSNMPMDQHRRYDLYGGPPHAAEDQDARMGDQNCGDEGAFFG